MVVVVVVGVVVVTVVIMVRSIVVVVVADWFTSCHVMLCRDSRHQIQQQDMKALQLTEQIVELKESIQSTCLQKDMLKHEKDNLGL